jgi:hypothetical protein
MTIGERNRLLDTAVSLDSTNPRSQRYNLRRGPRGLELFAAKWTEEAGGEPVYHGHPTSYVPARVLRIFLDKNLISESEYRKLVGNFGCP